MQSIVLKHCWCCPATTGLHQHHVIPQAYGGVDGPTVTVCGGCHTTVHTAALKAPHQWTALIPTANQDKFLQLIQIIYRARMATKNSPNKPMKMQLEFSVERTKKIRQLKALLGVSSLSSVIDRCIDKVYDQSTPIK